MGVPSLKFSKAIVPSTSNFYSTASNFNSTIRVQADFTNNSTTVSNVQDQTGWAGFGESSIRAGMFLMSSGETDTFTRITDWNPGTSTITLESPATGPTAANQTNVRIACPKGMYILESASISKQGTGEPNDMRDITGSSDADYNEGDQKWGIIAQLAKTTATGTPVQGEYSQYTILSVENRDGTNQANLIITASDEFPPFSEPDDHLAVASDQFMVSSFISESLMTLASAADLNMSQGFGVAAWNNSVASHLAHLTSGSGDPFPYTGSAEITGSLEVTGSVDFLINSYVDVSDVGELFKVSNALTPTQSLFSINQEGVATFRAREGSDGTPPVTVGSMYFTTESVFFGFDDGI